MNRQRLEFCTMIFMAEMRRRYAIMHPDTSENPVKLLDAYPAAEQGALMASLEKAITAADPVSDKMFQNWVISQPAENA